MTEWDAGFEIDPHFIRTFKLRISLSFNHL